jgi:hypothetical protein
MKFRADNSSQTICSPSWCLELWAGTPSLSHGWSTCAFSKSGIAVEPVSLGALQLLARVEHSRALGGGDLVGALVRGDLVGALGEGDHVGGLGGGVLVNDVLGHVLLHCLLTSYYFVTNFELILLHWG